MLQLFDKKQKKKKKRVMMSGTKIIREKTKIYCSESHGLSDGRSVKGNYREIKILR